MEVSGAFVSTLLLSTQETLEPQCRVSHRSTSVAASTTPSPSLAVSAQTPQLTPHSPLHLIAWTLHETFRFVSLLSLRRFATTSTTKSSPRPTLSTYPSPGSIYAPVSMVNFHHHHTAHHPTLPSSEYPNPCTMRWNRFSSDSALSASGSLLLAYR